MKKRYPIFLVVLGLALGTGACDREPAPPKEPVKSEEEIRREQEAARRADQTAALAQRVSQVTGSAGDLRARVEGMQFGAPASVQARVDEVVGKSAEPERLLVELQQASGDAWEAAHSRLEAALTEVEGARATAATALEEWQGKEQQALAARQDAESPVDPATGLIRGLDGGDYEQYLISVVEKVQEHLRRQGKYAGPVDGRFDRATLEAVGRFQEEHELQVSGVPSPMTRGRLFD